MGTAVCKGRLDRSSGHSFQPSHRTSKIKRNRKCRIGRRTVTNPNLKSYRLAIFDFDGTLADTLPWMRSIFNDLADEHGFRRVEPHEYDRFRDLHGHTLLRELDLPLWKVPRVLTSMRRRMAAHTGEFVLFPGISEVLQRLVDAKIQVAIVSSNSRENIERILGPANADRVAHFGCGVAMFGKASKLRQAIRHCKAQASETIYIGDEVRDAEAASSAAIAFGAVTWGQHSAENLARQNPAELFETVVEIGEKLCGSKAEVR